MAEVFWEQLHALGTRILRTKEIHGRRSAFMEYVAMCAAFPDDAFEYSRANFPNLLKVFCVFGQNGSFEVGTGDLERAYKVSGRVNGIVARTAGMPTGVVKGYASFGVDLFKKPSRLMFHRTIGSTDKTITERIFSLDGGPLKEEDETYDKKQKIHGHD